MNEYVVVIEGGPPSNYSAYVRDLPGCVATGDTLDEVRANIRDAVQLHINGFERWSSSDAVVPVLRFA